MDAAKLRDVLKAALPREKVLGLARELGAVQRQSVIELDELVNALVLSSRTPAGGRQADVLRAYVEATGIEPVRSSFYDRFSKQFEALLERLLRDSLAAVWLQDPVLLPHALQGVKDWVVIDSETVKLHKALKETYPGSGDYAAVKVHKAFSLGRHNMVDFEFSPARDHDSKFFPVTEAHRGYGLVFDLGYASHKRLRACEEHGASFVAKLKSGWKARIDAVHTGAVSQLFAGTDIADAVSLGQLSTENGVMDVDVTLGSAGREYRLRLVAIDTREKGLCVFLTNLPRETYPADVVGDIYRLRWEIEKSNKLDKSDFCLADLDCRKVTSANTMLYASLLGSVIVGRLVHADHCELAAQNAPLTRGPIHARALAMALAAMHVSLSTALEKDALDEAGWTVLARKLTHLASDPNWRRRPSVFDLLLGFVPAPLDHQKTIKRERKRS
jgi:hypothetical protein